MKTRDDGQDNGMGAQSFCSETLAQDISACALDLHQQLCLQEGNLLYSPYSISAALAMAHAGARGLTEMQMTRALHHTLPPDRLHAAFAALESKLAECQECGHIELAAANSIWPQQGSPLLDGYLSILKDHHGVTVTPLSYSDAPEAARETINRWVEERTNHRIRDLMQAGILDAQTRLVIINAIYFRAEWACRFQTTATKEAPFHVSRVFSVPVPMMRQEEWFRFAESRSVQVLELPYLGDALSMLILLPRRKDGLKRLEDSLSAKKLDQWRNSLRAGQVEVFLPKFRVTSAFRLDRALAAMGMTDAFIPGKADFSGMDGRPGWLFIGAVLHKAYIEVNEEGTEAAASTPVILAPTAAPGQPHVFRADHPFLFVICETRSGTPLFLGRVTDPTQTGD
jgi:serpin B